MCARSRSPTFFCSAGYLTGFFTSRPALKRYVRSSSSYFQAAKQLNALTWGNPEALARFADAMGIAQHHDAGACACQDPVRFSVKQQQGMLLFIGVLLAGARFALCVHSVGIVQAARCLW